MIFKQIKRNGDNFSYILADDTSKKAAVVDPSFNADTIVKTCNDLNLDVEYVIDTHSHGDHTAGNEAVKSCFNAKIVAHELSPVKKDLSVADGDTIKVGSLTIKVMHTPGHTRDGICLLVDGKLLTGDTLFVGECGRTDLPGASPEDMYHSLLDKLAKLDDNIEVYPGHDYGPTTHSTIGKEKRANYTLQKRTLKEFLEFMSQP
jgi:glyoxylase-like metal-dependent hydrolase (beta-lactamase superfamily II)